MSARATLWAAKQRPAGIAMKGALTGLAELCDQAGVCSAPAAEIAAAACTDERTVRRLLAKLADDHGLVEIERRPGRATVYRLPLPEVRTPGSQPGVTPGSQPGPTSGSQPGVDGTPGSQPGVDPSTPGSQPDVTHSESGLSARPLPLSGEVLPPPPTGVVPRAHARDAQAPARTRETRLPDDWAPHRGHQRHAHSRGVDLDHEQRQFRAHAHAHDRRCVSWDSAFDLWLGNARAVHRAGSSLLPAGASNGSRVPTTTARFREAQSLRIEPGEHP